MSNPLVIYHKNCNDGFGAAYAAWKKFGDSAEYFPMHYGDWEKLFEGYPNGSSMFDGRDVYVLDFSFDKAQTYCIMASAKSFTWLDHHKSAFENWCGPDYLTEHRQVYKDERNSLVVADTYILLDNQKSGCVLAWEYFHRGVEMPLGLMRIGDRDLWRFDSLNTKPFCAALDTYDKDFAIWDSLLEHESYFDLLLAGRTLLKAQEQRVKSFADPKKLKEVRFKLTDDTEVSGLGCNVVSDISETGNSIAQQSGTFSMTFFVTHTEVVCSLRSIGDYDVTPIARLHGGGGHKNAAGFKLPIDRFFKEIWNA